MRDAPRKSPVSASRAAASPFTVPVPRALADLLPAPAKPQNLIFRFLQTKARIQIWLFENTDTVMEGQIIVRPRVRVPDRLPARAPPDANPARRRHFA